MIEYLGKVAENLVRHGMIVEHDLARLYVKQWDEALQRYHRNHLLIDKLTINFKWTCLLYVTKKAY